jgi:hypothetical protein
MLLTFSKFAESPGRIGLFCLSKKDRTLIGPQAGVVLPRQYSGMNDVDFAFGGGLRGKYFGTNTLAIGFDIGFYAPKMQEAHINLATTSLRNTLDEEKRIGRVRNDTVQIVDLTTSSQYFPFNFSVEFYLPAFAQTYFRPYAGVGLGLNIINRRYSINYNIEMTPELRLFEERHQLSTNKGYASINPLLGFLWTLNRQWNINTELRYTHLLTSPFGSGALSFNVGVILDFGFNHNR